MSLIPPVQGIVKVIQLGIRGLLEIGLLSCGISYVVNLSRLRLTW